VVRQPRILASPFSPRGHERSPKSAPQHALTVTNHKNTNLMENIDKEIRQAELEKIKQEGAKLKSEKLKADKELEEIDKRLNTPFLKSKGFYQIIIATFTIGPLIWFYFTNAIQPVLERNKIELANFKDSLEIAQKEYRQDMVVFKEESKRLSEQLDYLDNEKQLLVEQLRKIQHEYSECINNNQTLNQEISQQIDRINYNIDFGQLNNYKIGFYFFPESEDIATKLKKYLQNQGFDGVIQLYPKNKDFFESVNPNKGYEIRYELAFEKNSAEKLKNILDKYDNGIDFKLRTVSSRTSGFISVFIPKPTRLGTGANLDSIQ